MSRVSSLSSDAELTPLTLSAPRRQLSDLRHRRFTVDEYEQLVKSGILTENDKCELIHGIISDKMVIGDSHSACVGRILRFFGQFAEARYLVRIQDPIRLADSVPEPDCVLANYRDDFYASGKPRPKDILLVVEVAESSLNQDRMIKMPLYASAGISEYWIANIVDSCIEVHRLPQPSGQYAEMRIYKRGESLSPLELPHITLAVNDILGPPQPQ